MPAQRFFCPSRRQTPISLILKAKIDGPDNRYRISGLWAKSRNLYNLELAQTAASVRNLISKNGPSRLELCTRCEWMQGPAEPASTIENCCNVHEGLQFESCTAVLHVVILNLTRRCYICDLKRTNDDRSISGQTVKTTSNELCPNLNFGFYDLQGSFDIDTPVEQGASN